MKKNILTMLIIAAGCISARAQKSCCAMAQSSTAEFASLTTDESFRNSHRLPAPFHYEAKGNMVEYKTTDGKTARAYFVRANELTTKCVFVFHEWWGLNDYIKQEADKLKEDLGGKVNVYAVDLYDGQVASNRETAAKIMGAMKEERARAIISGLIKHVGSRAEIATIGWCMGGGWSMQAAIMCGKQNKLCVLYYGMPEKDVAKLKELPGGILGIFATKDHWINADVVKSFQENLEKAGKLDDAGILSYDADHAFANPSNGDIYNKEATVAAYQKVIFFMRKYLLAEIK